MSGLVGKGIRSYKKASVSDSNNPALGFRNFIMAFEVSAAVGAGVAIELANDAMPLTPPAEMVTAGFQAPSNIEIINAQLGTFRNNVTVTSNLNGILIDRVSYTLTDTTITFDDGLNAGEIIVIKRGNEVINGNRIVDARPLRASGTVNFSTIGSAPVIFEVGEGFRIAPSTTATGGIDNRQIGFVQVFADGVLQARNVGNEDESMLPATEQTGNYREVIVDGNGNLLATQNGVTANAIEFNQFQPFSAEEGVIVISTNLIVDSPNNTGVIDQVGALDARVTGVETDVTANTGNIATNTAAIASFSSGSGGEQQVITQLGGTAANSTNGVSTSYTWVCPTNVFTIFLDMAGGGGGGSGGSVGQSGGGGSSVFFNWFDVIPGQTYNFLIGQGGGIQTGATGNGTNGALTAIAGSATALLNNEADVNITCIGGSGATTSGGGTGSVTYNTPANNIVQTNPLRTGTFRFDQIGQLQNINALALWNTTTFKTSGATGSNSGGGIGGNTWFGIGSSSAGNNGGGGGAGFTAGGTGASGGGGQGQPGGQGGVRLTWFSNDQTAAANPFVIV